MSQGPVSKESTGWHLLDPQLDSIAGLSLERTYKELVKEGGLDPIIVAIIDSAVDIDHPDLQGAIYTNTGEIPQNGIDDDLNGYVDDVHGWNFLGYDGDRTVLDGVYPHIHVLQQQEDWQNKRHGAKEVDPQLLQLAKEALASKSGENEKDLESSQRTWESYLWLRKTYGHLFPNEADYDYALLDSLGGVADAKEHMQRLMYLYIGQMGTLKIKEAVPYALRKETVFNNPMNRMWDRADSLRYVLEHPGRGTPYVQAYTHELTHGTQVATVIGARRGNGQGIRGFGNHIKIMPLVITSNANARDKDFFNAVKYAVDNGAKIINYSNVKPLSENREAYRRAFAYMAEHGVLFVCAAGNGRKDLDLPENILYPHSSDYLGHMGNVIKVGASDEGEGSYGELSSYGKGEVDVFAPGMWVPVGYTHDYYVPYTSGTSFASASTAGAAAVVWSVRPGLSADGVKRLLLESSKKYATEVTLGDGSTKRFDELSRTGGVVNVYNAVKMLLEEQP